MTTTNFKKQQFSINRTVRNACLTLLFVFFFSINCYGQVLGWVNSYNGPGMGFDVGGSVVTDLAGNVYVTGTSMGSGTGLDYVTIKYSPSGAPSPTWPDVGFGVGVRRYNGPVSGFDEAIKIFVDPMGNVYVTGYITNTPATG